VSNFVININGDTSDLLPAGVRIEATLNQSRLTSDLVLLNEAIMFIHKEAATAQGLTSAERVLSERLALIEKGIVGGLSPEAKLEIANKALGG
jgi:hypothetical protein